MKPRRWLMPLLAPLAAAALLTTATAAEPTLTRRIAEILERQGLDEAQVGICAIELDSGRTLVERLADEPLTPASTMKLLVSSGALALLGPDHALHTRLSRRGHITAAGVLAGDLVITGGGDPNLSGRFYAGGQEAILATWAKVMADGLGVREIQGDVVADNRLFGRDGVDASWPRDQLHKWYCAEVSALSFNDNCVDVSVSPGAAPGQPARIQLQPGTGYLTVVNRCITTANKSDHVITLDRRPGSRELRVGGKVWTKASPFTGYVTVPDPALFFATLLREALVTAGIEVRGRARLINPQARPAPMIGVADWVSRLEPTVGICNRRSQNLYAECLLRLVGASSGKTGTAAQGGTVLRRFLQDQVGLPAKTFKIQDGSGLSRLNHVTPRAMTQLLRHAHGQPWGRALRASLARPGESGTLRKRLSSLPAGVMVSAKTGTLNGVSALAGYIDSPGRPAVAFAILTNQLPGGASPARRAQDEIVALLASRREP